VTKGPPRSRGDTALGYGVGEPSIPVIVSQIGAEGLLGGKASPIPLGVAQPRRERACTIPAPCVVLGALFALIGTNS